ncbi:MAG: ABC transporter permease [Spirochaetales bacterium]|jgi:putative ABC transport system permease protein
MSLGKLISLSTRSIMRNRMRSLLTSLGIIIGVCSVIVMVAVGQGSQQQIAKNIASMGTNLLMVMPPRGPNEANRLTESDLSKIKAESSYIGSISGAVQMGDTEVVGGAGNWSTTVKGVQEGYPEIMRWTIADGEFFSQSDEVSRSKVAVIGSTVAAKLFTDAEPVGQKLRIGSTIFTVIGVLKSKGSSGMGDDQDDVVMVPLSTALARLQKDKYLGSIEMSVSREDQMTAAQQEVTSILREAHRLKQGEANDFNVMNQADIIATASASAATLTTLLAAIAGVSLIVGGIGIMNIMLVSVTERTREIGIRMAVGARRKDILLQFLSESILLSLLGGAIGIALALIIAKLLSSVAQIPAIINPIVVAISAGFAAAVGVFFGYYPARKASRLYPIEALRYE